MKVSRHSSGSSLLIWLALIPLVALLTGINSCDTTDADADGWSVGAGDCDDSDAAVNPGATESCNSRDDDCDAAVDEDLPQVSWWADADGDGYGDPAGAASSCQAPVNSADNSADCDDSSAAAHPGGIEACDGLDNDCDGTVDEGFPGLYFPDVDGDGFGAGLQGACLAAVGLVQSRGDCDDANGVVHPGAADTLGDGIDADCGGFDGADPFAGLGSGSSASIQAALDTALSGNTVWVGPGTYLEHDLSFKGKAVRLISTGLAAATTVDAKALGKVIAFSSGETSSALLDGFTLRGANKGGMTINASPTIRGCVITGNASGVALGGGVWVSGGSPTLDGCTLSGNSSQNGGGGLYVSGSATSVQLIGCVFDANSAPYGGGINANGGTTTMSGGRLTSSGTSGGGAYLSGGTLNLLGSTVTRCTATDSGGGVYISAGKLSATGVLFDNNSATANGGAIYAGSGTITVTGSSFTANKAKSAGALMLAASSQTITGSVFSGNTATLGSGGAIVAGLTSRLANLLITGNTASSSGGGISISSSSSPTIDHCTIVRNTASLGGGVYLSPGVTNSGVTTIKNSILAYNSSFNLMLDRATQDTGVAKVDVSYTALYHRAGPNHNVTGLAGNNLEVDPGLVAISNGSNAATDDYRLTPESVLKDAGTPGDLDLDGSSAELGAFGGPGADPAAYADADGDGLYDTWEAAHGLDVRHNDAAADPDGDGATNLEELSVRGDPQRADTDGDGAADGAEAAAGSRLDDSFSRPGVVGALTVRVPEDFASLQAAIDAIPWEGRIDLGPGSWPGLFSVVSKGVEIFGRGGVAATILTGGSGSVLTSSSAVLTLRDLTITGGNVNGGSGIARGGGVNLTTVRARLENLYVHHNSVKGGYMYGGGVYAGHSQVTITDSRIEQNSLTGNGSCYGRGMAAELGELNVSGSSFSNNVSSTADLCYGGGLSLVTNPATVTDCRFSGNSANYGSGFNSSCTAVELLRCTFDGNVTVGAGSAGGGVSLSEPPDQGTPSLADCTISGNGGSSGLGWGGIYSPYAATLTGCRISGNKGVGAYLREGRASSCRIDGNFGDGVSVNSGQVVENSRIEGNTGNGVSAGSGSLTNVVVTGSGKHGISAGSGSLSLVHVAIVGNGSGPTTAGLYTGTGKPTVRDSILAYNKGYNLLVSQSTYLPTVSSSDLYNPVSSGYSGNVSGYALPAGVVTVEPGFRTYGAAGTPVDFHLGLGSPLIDGGSVAAEDLDGSRGDLGTYGGSLGGSFDLDRDGLPDWFWPGSIGDAPGGFDGAQWDCEDMDGAVSQCGG